MLNCNEFYRLLNKGGIDFFTGIPDSLLKDFCAYVTDNTKLQNHIIAANEGGAVGLATGYYLATGKFGLVYMQNSGEGNAVNPLVSLADPEVYSIPMLLLIGWRGEPGKKDEPQHIKQGKITLSLLETLGIPYEILPDTLDDARKTIEKAFQQMKENNAPYAMVVRKGTFESYTLQNKTHFPYQLMREDAVKLIVDSLDKDDIVISTTGKTSRELFEYRGEKGHGHSKDFLTVGSMGHTSQIALSVALQKKDNNVFCIDGDGAVIMHMGSLAIIGQQKPNNFKHVVINNGAHDSVGGQPTVGFEMDIPAVAKACGYQIVLKAQTHDEINDALNKLKLHDGPGILEILVNKGSRANLGRPTSTPIENKKNFMSFLSK